MEQPKPKMKYIIMAFMPTIAPSIPRIIGFSKGDAIRNDIVEPNGMPA